MPSQAKVILPAHARVLLVDSHRSGLKARCMVLEEQGHTALGVTSPDEALHLLETESFDIIVTEYRLSGCSGIEFIARLREVTPGTPIILLSGYVDALGLSVKSTGADAVVMKSATEPQHLKSAVRSLLRSRQPARKKPTRKPPASEQTTARPLVKRAASGK